MLNLQNLVFLVAGSAKIRSLTAEDRFSGVLPISHAVGLPVVLLGSLSGTAFQLANVYPAEVEAVFNAHPAVMNSSVIGRCVEGDEEAVAFIPAFAEHGSDRCRSCVYAAEHLAQYRRPSQIFFVPNLPLTPTGKVIKAELAKNSKTALSPAEKIGPSKL
jgi:hypothetical protein